MKFFFNSFWKYFSPSSKECGPLIEQFKFPFTKGALYQVWKKWATSSTEKLDIQTAGQWWLEKLIWTNGYFWLFWGKQKEMWICTM